MENIQNFNSQFPDSFTHNLMPAKFCHSIELWLCLPKWKQTQQNEENSLEGNSMTKKKKWIPPGDEYQCRIQIHM
jgi:hypothetical protein